jgi:hypothetical protein
LEYFGTPGSLLAVEILAVLFSYSRRVKKNHRFILRIAAFSGTGLGGFGSAL